MYTAGLLIALASSRVKRPAILLLGRLRRASSWSLVSTDVPRLDVDDSSELDWVCSVVGLSSLAPACMKTLRGDEFVMSCDMFTQARLDLFASPKGQITDSGCRLHRSPSCTVGSSNLGRTLSLSLYSDFMFWVLEVCWLLFEYCLPDCSLLPAAITAIRKCMIADPVHDF